MFVNFVLQSKQTTWSNIAGVNISLDDFSLSSKYQKTAQPSMNQMATTGPVCKCIFGPLDFGVKKEKKNSGAKGKVCW